MNLDPLPIINAVVKDSTAFMGWRVEPIGDDTDEEIERLSRQAAGDPQNQ